MMRFATILLGAAMAAVLAASPVTAAPKKKPAPAPAPAPSGPPQATFYELTETMQLLARRNGAQARVATSALSGVAAVGTMFCPETLAYAVMAEPKFCTLVAIGRDNVSLLTGLGTFQASLDIVVQGDNPVDGPEFLVGGMNVSGKMDFSPAILSGAPYGTVTGTLQGRDTPTPRPRFVGVFRLPFLGSTVLTDAGGNALYADEAKTIPLTARMALCPATPAPNPYFDDWDIAYLDTSSTGVPQGTCTAIRPDELALGVPAVRFDIWFQ